MDKWESTALQILSERILSTYCFLPQSNWNCIKWLRRGIKVHFKTLLGNSHLPDKMQEGFICKRRRGGAHNYSSASLNIAWMSEGLWSYEGQWKPWQGQILVLCLSDVILCFSRVLNLMWAISIDGVQFELLFQEFSVCSFQMERSNGL